MAGRRLPVIVGFGGINAAGRASGHHAYARTVWSALPAREQQRTGAALAGLMGLSDATGREPYLLDHSLVRRIEEQHFDVQAVPWNQRLPTHSNGEPISFSMLRKHLPDVLPTGWEVTGTSVTHVRVRIQGEQEFLLPAVRELEVKSAGQLPRGFEPGRLYPSRNHPRGLQMSIYAASDALGSLGLDWEDISARVAPDEVSVYAGSAMGQLDDAGTGGMLKVRSNGQRVSARFCPLGFAEMPADFINAYVLGSLGSTGASLGACASFLYNLRQAVDDICAGRARVAFVGAAEAPITPEVMEGYAAMGALATEQGLRKLEGLGADQAPDFRRACRPFGENCGFTIAESAQMLVLFDDALALELGAQVFGAVTGVFVNADGYKKSISGPGVGNYFTVARALDCARALLGEQGIRQGGLVQAHGTGTPQNRVSEAAILSRTAAAFGIEDWPVVAVKCFLGHSIGAAGGDQITSTLGLWQHGILPGITTIDAVADDVATAHLAFSTAHREIDPLAQRYAIINSKGFGGNNASATLMSPEATRRMLQARYSKREWVRWQDANQLVRDRQQAYDDGVTAGQVHPVYRFDHNVLADSDVSVTAEQVTAGGRSVRLSSDCPFEDMRLG